MEKKYKLIEDKYGWFRVKSLKDFTLITGETVKKGDVGGLVKSEDCLSQEGNCWVMTDAVVDGNVSGNAVIKDEALIYGTVTDNAIIKDTATVHGTVSGNAVIKDYAYVSGKASENSVVKACGFVGPNATVTGNAVVQAYQLINYGTVTTDLLGTKDWTGALYAELGVVPKDGKIILYKRVWSTDNPKVFESVHDRKFIYEIGKEAVETDVDENVMKYCGKGLHFTTLEIIGFQRGNTILECEINLEDIITVQYDVVRARKCRVLGIFKEE